MSRLATLAALLALLPASVDAQPDDPFAAIRTADPVELARLVDREGDEAVLERLDHEDDEVRLAAIRACRFLVGPEHALGPLVAIASGEHPVLAPAAARALLLIGDTLSRHGMRRREADLAEVGHALEALDELANDVTARPDLRAVGAHVAAQLRPAISDPSRE